MNINNFIRISKKTHQIFTPHKWIIHYSESSNIQNLVINRKEITKKKKVSNQLKKKKKRDEDGGNSGARKIGADRKRTTRRCNSAA